jgi:hypothetical protein
MDRVFVPDGSILKASQFKAVYGGYTFGMDAENERTVRNAFEAFTECQAVRFPKVSSTCFRPRLGDGAIINEEGRTLINTYVNINTPRQQGDATPFINHVKLLLPKGDDAEIVLSYMAAMVQNPGVKFQWAPLIQGVEGNGKTILSTCMAHAVGHRYTHNPKSSDVGNKFNAWVRNTLFAAIEEIYCADRRELLEEMKTLITNNRVEIQMKGVDQVTGDNYVNFLIFTNHKDGVPITLDTRRYAPLYCAQQTREQKTRDFGGQYFEELYTWFRAGGYEIVTQFLADYEVDARFNPAGLCQDAPRTSSTLEAVEISRGGVEQVIIEHIEEGRPGFANGWVSGHALDNLLIKMRMDRAIPPRKRRELLKSIGYDWHPGLVKGRVNNPIAVEGGKPKIYIQVGHIHSNLKQPAEIAKHYCEAQGYAPMMGEMAGAVS